MDASSRKAAHPAPAPANAPSREAAAPASPRTTSAAPAPAAPAAAAAPRRRRPAFGSAHVSQRPQCALARHETAAKLQAIRVSPTRGGPRHRFRETINRQDSVTQAWTPEELAYAARVSDCVETISASGAPDNSSLSHFSAMTRPSWLGPAVRNRHRHAIEQASRRWRGGRRGDSGRTHRKILISTGSGTCTGGASSRIARCQRSVSISERFRP